MLSKFEGVLSKPSNRTAGWHSGQRSVSGARPTSAGTNQSSSDLPGWNDLDTPENKRIAQQEIRSGLAAWPATRMLLWLVVLGIALTLYVGHVHATEELLTSVEELRDENLRLQLKHNRLTGELHRLAGPTVIYDRARRLGLVDGRSFGPTIYIEQ